LDVFSKEEVKKTMGYASTINECYEKLEKIGHGDREAVLAWAEAVVRAHGGSEAVLARAEAVVRAHGGTEAVLARAEAVVRAHGGSEAVLAREASHRNLQSHPTLRCLAPFARVGDVAAAQEDLLPRIGAGFTGLPGDLQRRLRLLYEATRAAEEAGGRTAEGGHTLVHQSFVARAWANLLESLDFLAQTHELNIRVNELGWYLGPLAAVAAGALGYFLFGRSGASAGLPAPSSPPAAPTGPRGPRPAGTAALVTVVRVAEFLVQLFGVTEEGTAEMSNTSP